ncbi:hypothetical protein [Archangium lansingense]|uniref:Uncharacterized protein n=1 Tax=Archangium lansingense TaxID=2995310 RepID=A0ABT4ARA0_9BACT|nr:hypothetical protein [Archangium lansinium]MCY1083796.1 hypothetical protein [Archangium lansinium]
MAGSRWEQKPIEYMAAHVTEAFFRDTLLALRDANRIALAHCRDLAPEWRKGALAHHRREFFNQYWSAVARRHGAKARPVLNGNNATSHLEVTTHNIIFTPVAAQSPGEFPRDADYRNTLAAGNQLEMFAKLGLEEEKPPPGSLLYAVFSYSSDMDEETGLPLFALVGFPHKRKKRYVATRSLFSLIIELGNASDAAQKLSQPPDTSAPQSPFAAPPPQETERKPEHTEYKEERTDEDDPPLRLIPKDKKDKDSEKE